MFFFKNEFLKKLKITINKFNILYFCLIFCLMLEGFSYGEKAIIIRPEQQLAFAEIYFDKGEYFRAISEYERFIFFFPDNLNIEHANYQIGQCYFKAGHYDEAIIKFQEISQTNQINDVRKKAFIMKSKCYIEKKQLDIAISILYDLISISNSSDVHDQAYYKIAWIYLKKEDFMNAGQAFKKISDKNIVKYKLDKLTKDLQKEALLKKKNPGIAGFLAIIPGAGHAYCNRYRDAMLSFIVNGSLIYAAYEGFENNNNGLGAIISFFGSGFYAGNIYSAMSSAHKYNARQKNQFLKQLRGDYYIKE